MDQEVFKTTLMGGFDKDDVLEQVQKMKDAAMDERARFKKTISEKDAKIAELQRRLDLKDMQQLRLEQDIREKYQKYIDKYDSILKLVFDAQVRADEILAQTMEECERKKKDTQEECQRMREETESEVQEARETARKEIDENLLEGKQCYLAIQKEMDEIVDVINQAQKRFMASYKKIHSIVNAAPEPLGGVDLDEEFEEA